MEGCRIFDRFRCALQGSSYVPALLTISAWRWMKPRHTSLSCRISEVNSSCELQMKEWVVTVTLWSMNIKSYTWMYRHSQTHLPILQYLWHLKKCCANMCVNISSSALRLYTLQTSPSPASLYIFLPTSIYSFHVFWEISGDGWTFATSSQSYIFQACGPVLKRSKKSQNNLKLKQEN